MKTQEYRKKEHVERPVNRSQIEFVAHKYVLVLLPNSM